MEQKWIARIAEMEDSKLFQKKSNIPQNREKSQIYYTGAKI